MAGYQQGGMTDADARILAGGARMSSFDKLKARQRARVVGNQMVMMPDGTTMKMEDPAPTPMSKRELNIRIRDGREDKDELEAEAIERSYDSVGIGGRIVEHANGALEWVPNGPGDIPQPPTGDVFFDPIELEQQQLESKGNREQLLRRLQASGMVTDKQLSQFSGRERKFARGGVVRNFQAGGLAAVTPPLDPEEDELALPFDPADVTGTEELIPDPAPDPMAKLRGMAQMNRDDALKVLRATQEEFKTRRTAQRKQQEQDKWLALAQAMLSPTKTGGFGESLGMAAGALRGESSERFEEEQAMSQTEQRLLDTEFKIAGDYFDALSNIEGFKNTSRARVVGTKTVITPEDNARIEAGEITEADAERNVISIIMQPDGETVSRIETDPSGRPWVIVDPSKVPTQAAAQKAAVATAGAAVEGGVAAAKLGINAIPIVTKLQRAYGLLSSLKEDTSGLNEKMRQVAQWAGISEVITDNTKLATLHQMFGRQVLDDLRMLTGSKTDYEYGKVEGMNANLGKSVPESLAILDEHMVRLNEFIDKGEFAAQGLATGPGTEEKEFWLQQFLRHRESQAAAAVEYDRQTRLAPEAKNMLLIDMIQENEGNPEEQRLIMDEFREWYDITDEVALELRKLGAGI